jgi:hypothetical protein
MTAAIYFLSAFVRKDYPNHSLSVHDIPSTWIYFGLPVWRRLPAGARVFLE